jgi:hypothetical protein
MVGDGFSWRRLASVLIAGAALAAAAGCGSDDDSSAARESARQAPPAASSDEAMVKKVIADSKRDFTLGNGVAFCARLVPSERRDVVAFAQYISKAKTCPAALEKLSIGTTPERPTTADDPPQTVNVRIDGDRATATVRDEPDSAARSVELVKVGGDWKLLETGFDGDPLASAADDAGVRAKP